MSFLPVGKLPPALLEQTLSGFVQTDARVKVGPGSGLDCAVIDMGSHYLVAKTDPITFVSEDIGKLVVHICANDIVTTGAVPKWFMPTILLPEKGATREGVLNLTRQIQKTCESIGVLVVGGHTEVTHGIERVLISGTMLGEVAHNQLVTPLGVELGDVILLTKEIPIEGLGILGKSLPQKYHTQISEPVRAAAARYALKPGVSVLEEARLACETVKVHAMHDPTEGGLAAALWELADASRHSFVIQQAAIPIAEPMKTIAAQLFLNPLATIASGSLLIVVAESDAPAVIAACREKQIACTAIGAVSGKGGQVWLEETGSRRLLERPQRDEIARLFDGF